jgi:hypothetical protein
LVRYYLDSCEYKWTHANTKTEWLWIERKLGEELFKYVDSNKLEWKLLHSNSQTLPADIYCRCDIFVEITDSKYNTHFALKFPKAKLVERTIC